MYVSGVEHGDLAKDADVLAQAIEYFRPESRQPSTGASRAAAVDEEAEFSNTPQPFDGVKLETEGSVHGYVSDDAGNILGNSPSGPEGTVLRNIPGGSHNSTADYQSFFLNDEGFYTGEFEVVGRGSVQLEVQTYAKSHVRREAVFRVKVPVGAKLRIALATGQADLKLQIDQDGDGTEDREVAPNSTVVGPAAGETDPPNTTATFNPAAKGRFSVVLSTKDGSEGSGVADTYYTLGADTKSRPYTGVFTVPSGTLIRFLSVDRVGNIESIRKTTAKPGG